MLHLPAASPELNPAENIWEYLRQTHLSNRVFASYQARRRRRLFGMEQAQR